MTSPRHFFLLHSWLRIFPFNDFYGRLLSLAIGILGIIAIFFLGKEVKDSKLGLIASLFTAINYLHIYFSQEVRFYTLVFLLSSLSYLFFIRAAKSARVLVFFLYSLSTLLLLYTHYFGLVVFASQGILFVLIIILYPVDKRFILLSILFGMLVVIGVSPWIPIFFSDAKAENFWIQPIPVFFLINYFWVYFKDVLSCFFFAVLLIVYFFSLYKQFRSRHSIDRVDMILFGGTALSFLIPLLYSLVQTPMLHVRYTLIALPSLIVMISLGIRLIGRPGFQKTILIITFCSSLISLVVFQKFYSEIKKEDWRGIVTAVINEAAPGDVSVSRHSWYCNYYFKSLHSPIRAIQSSQFNLENQKPTGVWWLDGFDMSPGLNPLEVTLLKNGYLRRKSDSLYGAKASYYQLPSGHSTRK